MASSFASRAFSRTSRSSLRAALPRPSSSILARQPFRQQYRRGYASDAGKSSSGGGGKGLVALLGLGAAGGAGYYAYANGLLDSFAAEKKPFEPTFEDYQKVYDAIAARLADNTDYDDGSYGPVVLRLAWHASGTYVFYLPFQYEHTTNQPPTATTKTQTQAAPTVQQCASTPNPNTAQTLAF